MMRELLNDKMHLVVEAFHSLPHLDMWFILSNSTFDPNNSDYLETILFWTTAPILTLILILLVLILYACCLVCISNSASIKLHQSFQINKKKNSLCMFKTVIWFFVIILGSLLGLIVFGSENFHYSFNDLTGHVQNFSVYFLKVGNQTKITQNSIMHYINVTFVQFENDLKNKTLTFPKNHDRVDDALREITGIKSALYESYRSLAYLSNFNNEKEGYFKMFEQAKVMETTRWAIMVTTVVINMLLVTLLITGLIRNSKGSLCFFAFAGVLSLITIWILNAIYLGITVFISDYCISPDEYITRVSEQKHVKNLVYYYTSCPKQTGRTIFTPFRQDLNRAESKLRTAAILYTDNLVKMSKSILGDEKIRSYNFINGVWETERLVDSLRSMTRCDQTSVEYKATVEILCTHSIFSLAIIVVSGIIFGFIMPILICIIPQMWRRMTNKAYYKYHGAGPNINSDESNPFIPMSSGNGQVRSNISAAARQFNESPSFQRLVNHQQSNSTLGRNRNNNGSTLSRNNNNNHYNSNMNQNVYASATMNRVEDYVMNTDPYLMYKGVPSAPPPNNYAQSNYASAHVPIVLYPNQNGTRTLSNRQNSDTLMRNQRMNNYQMN